MKAIHNNSYINTERKPVKTGRLHQLINHCANTYNRLTLRCYRHRHAIMVSSIVAVLVAVIFAPEQASAEPLEGQLDKFNTIMVDKVKKYGISSATICGGIWSLFKGNIKLTGLIIAIGVALSFFLKWVEGGMVIG